MMLHLRNLNDCFIIVCISNVVNTYGFVMRGANSLLIKDGVVYKVDMIINEDSYEMINKEKLNLFAVDEDQLIDFDDIARHEFHKKKTVIEHTTQAILEKTSETTMYYTTTSTPVIWVITVNNEVKTTFIGQKLTRTSMKREIIKENDMEYETEYNYNDLLNEYNEEANDDVQIAVTEIQDYGIVNSLKSLFLQNENQNYNKSIGLQAIKALINDYQHQQRLTMDIVARLWRILQIWFLVYLAIAIPLWCTRGWCCCCLFCKFFKPRQTIEEAKKYVTSNPPGLFHTKNAEVLYDPTEREKETYEEFEHFIKTL